MMKKRKETKFFKKVKSPYKHVILKCFEDGIIEIGETYVKFHKQEGKYE